MFGSGSVFFYVFQIATVVILSLAANTAYAGMPLLLAMVARDGYMPRRYTQRGARLNFSNGVLLIFFASSALIFLFNADTHTLLPLYATGVFISFTISQAGMLAHWVKLKTPGWQHKAVINALGTVVCAVVCLVIAITRFTEGAWVVVILIPLLVYVMKSIKKHYATVSADLTLRSTDEARDMLRYIMPGKVIIPALTTHRFPAFFCRAILRETICSPLDLWQFLKNTALQALLGPELKTQGLTYSWPSAVLLTFFHSFVIENRSIHS